MSANIFSLDKVNYSYWLGEHEVHALKTLSVDLKANQMTCLSGPSGSGKSTLLNLLGLLDSPKTGKFHFQGKDMLSLSEAEKEKLRLFELGFIFQAFNLFPTLTVAENVEYFVIRQKVAAKERKERVSSALEAVGLFDQKNKFPNQMSGGQRQRVAIARAIAKKPKVILADEPTASLDQENGRKIIELLKESCKTFGLTAIIASHDPMVISAADQGIRIKDGKIQEG